MDTNLIIKKVDKYHFFDGINNFYVEDYTYDSWFSSSDFNIYGNANIQIDELKIDLFHKKSKALISFNKAFKKEDLSFIPLHFDMILKNKSNDSFLVTRNHLFDNFYISVTKSKSNNYVIIYGIGGSRFPESIYVHGIWELALIPIELD